MILTKLCKPLFFAGKGYRGRQGFSALQGFSAKRKILLRIICFANYSAENPCLPHIETKKDTNVHMINSTKRMTLLTILANLALQTGMIGNALIFLQNIAFGMEIPFMTLGQMFNIWINSSVYLPDAWNLGIGNYSQSLIQCLTPSVIAVSTSVLIAVYYADKYGSNPIFRQIVEQLDLFAIFNIFPYVIKYISPLYYYSIITNMIEYPIITFMIKWGVSYMIVSNIRQKPASNQESSVSSFQILSSIMEYSQLFEPLLTETRTYGETYAKIYKQVATVLINVMKDNNEICTSIVHEYKNSLRYYINDTDPNYFIYYNAFDAQYNIQTENYQELRNHVVAFLKFATELRKVSLETSLSSIKQISMFNLGICIGCSLMHHFDYQILPPQTHQPAPQVQSHAQQQVQQMMQHMQVQQEQPDEATDPPAIFDSHVITAEPTAPPDIEPLTAQSSLRNRFASLFH